MPQLFFKLSNHPVRVGAAAIAFVDKRNTGDFVAFHLLIDRYGLGLDASNSTKNERGPIQDSQRTFDFDRKVYVARGIDDIDFVAQPLAVGGRRSNRDAAFFFEFH